MRFHTCLCRKTLPRVCATLVPSVACGERGDMSLTARGSARAKRSRHRKLVGDGWCRYRARGLAKPRRSADWLARGVRDMFEVVS